MNIYFSISRIKGIVRFLLHGSRGNQLELILPLDGMCKKTIIIPDGFLLRQYEKNDMNGVLQLFEISGFHGWGEAKIKKVIDSYIDNGFFVIVDEVTSNIVSTMAARIAFDRKDSKSGCITWLCSHPEYRGKRLGYFVACAALNRLLDEGCDEIFVNTDDKRLSAIKIFLALGFQPVMYNSTMQNRWRLIKDKINAAR